VFDLYLITPERPPGEIVAGLTAALDDAPAGRVAVQLRARHLAERELWALARALRALTRERGAPLLINAAVELAREVAADGVQLPERGPTIARARSLLPAVAMIGASRHDLAGVNAAASGGASFVTLSPVFAVADKGEPLGVERFGAIARASALPVIALGGITAARTADVITAGARGVAVIRELSASGDPKRAVARLLAAVDAGRRGNASPRSLPRPRKPLTIGATRSCARTRRTAAP
jgi:thiamine-phosphate pyrophosphorylase